MFHVLFRVIKRFWEKQEAIFNMCINQLPSDMKKRYEELVIFREDVNITPQVINCRDFRFVKYIQVCMYMLLFYFILSIDIRNSVGRISISS